MSTDQNYFTPEEMDLLISRLPSRNRAHLGHDRQAPALHQLPETDEAMSACDAPQQEGERPTTVGEIS